MLPTPGGQLEAVSTALADPLFVIVARLAKGPTANQDDPIVLADLIEADFPGYAPVTLTADLSDPVDLDGFGEMTPQQIDFTVGAIVTSQRITHIYYTKTYNGAGTSLVSAVAFDVPIIVDRPGQELNFLAAVGGYKTD